MKYKYTGSDSRVFPTLGISVNPGDEFEAPENFEMPNVVLSGAKKLPTSSTTLGE